MESVPPPLPYPALRRHGVIGDRRSAALVAADGTINWLCHPHFSGGVVFGAILDHCRGGHWRLGPATPSLGEQRYHGDTATLVTVWDRGEARLELVDFMAWPDQMGESAPRAVVRRLRCPRGQSRAVLDFQPRWDFGEPPPFNASSQRVSFHVGPHAGTLWTSRALEAQALVELSAGEEIWAVLELDGGSEDWSPKRARSVRREAERYWHKWAGAHKHPDVGRHVRRAALTVNLLTYGPEGAAVAAPTTSLPERIGGDWNADYRFAWVRDTSLAMGVLSLLGNTDAGERYLQWLARRATSVGAPLQVLYGVRGEPEPVRHERRDLYGYRGSLPVRFGNHAFRQHQHDALGYLADCAYLHLRQGGRWQPEFWELLRRIANHVADTWQEPGNGIWELSVRQHFLSGKVMGWVALDRVLKIAEALGEAEGASRWRWVRDTIYQDVMERGWCDCLGAFRQRYEADNLDAAALLIPVMDFLPPDHPRVAATVERIAERLTLDGFVYRFVPRETPGTGDVPLGQYEGAFLPCTYWLATAYAKIGRVAEAEAVVRRAEAVAGPLGLFAEGVDTRDGTFLGNTPLMFSHVEYARAALEIARARLRP